MYKWIMELFGLGKPCKYTERDKLLICLNSRNNKKIKKHINAFIRARNNK